MPALCSSAQPQTRAFYIAAASLLALLLLPEYCAPFLAIIAVIFAYRDAREQTRKFRLGAFALPLATYILYLFVGVFYALDKSSALSIALMWAVMAGVYVALCNLLTSRSRIRFLLNGLALAVAIIGIIACIEYLLNALVGPIIPKQFWDPLDAWVYSFSPVYIRLDNEGLRMASTFSNPNIFAEAMVILLPLGFYGATAARGKKERRYYILCILAGTIGTLFSFSRGSYFSLFVMALVAILLNLNHILRLQKSQLAALGGIIFLVALLLILVPNAFIDRLETLNLSDVSVRERLRMWEAGIRVFWPHTPTTVGEFTAMLMRVLFGIGAGTGNSTLVLTSFGIDAPHMHNLAIQLFVEGGLTAIVLIGMLLVKLTASALQLRKTNREGWLFSNAVFVFLFGFLLFGTVDFPFLCPKLVGTFLLVLGTADAASRVLATEPLSVESSI